MKTDELKALLKDSGMRKTKNGCWLCSSGNLDIIRLAVHNNQHHPLPTHSIVYMTCGRKKCVAPDHMEVSQTLIQRQVDEIRKLAKKGLTIKELAAKYEACTHTVRNIINKRSVYRAI